MYLEHWGAGFTFSGPHIVFPTLLLAAWRDHYRFERKMFLPEALPTIEAASSEACVWSPSTADIPLWHERISEDPRLIFELDLIEAMADENLAQYPQLADAFQANRLRPFDTNIPLQIWQGTDDDVVLYAHTAEMVADFEEAGMTVDFQVVEGAGHVDLAFGFVAFQERRTAESIAWIRSHLNP
jgi:pimeloyl-ACP methyl ester carboxylesterase